MPILYQPAQKPDDAKKNPASTVSGGASEPLSGGLPIRGCQVYFSRTAARIFSISASLMQTVRIGSTGSEADKVFLVRHWSAVFFNARRPVAADTFAGRLLMAAARAAFMASLMVLP